MLPAQLSQHCPKQEDNQVGQVLDDTVVGIVVEDMDISGLQDPVRLTFAHRQLLRVSWMCPPSPCLSTEAQAHTTLPFAECHPAVCLLGSQPRYWSCWGQEQGSGAVGWEKVGGRWHWVLLQSCQKPLARA